MAAHWIRSISSLATAIAASAAGAEDMPAIDAVSVEGNETIIVTGIKTPTVIGTKTDTPLIDVPQSISVVTPERFTGFGALNLQETLRYTAGVHAEVYGIDTRSDNALIRGVEPTTYQDGMRRLYGGYRTGNKQEIFTLDRVEVLRGPASMLYGQAPTGGLINTTSKQPLFDRHVELFGSYGTYNRKEIGVDLTGPIVTDTVAARIVGVWHDGDTQIDRVGDRRWSFAPSLSWTPDDRTSVTVLGLIQDDDSGWTNQFVPYAASLRGDGAPLGKLPFRVQLGEPDDDKVNLSTKNVSLLITHRFSDHIRFRSSARYEWSRSNQSLYYPDSYSNPTHPFVPADDPSLNLYFPAYAALGDGRVLNRYSFAERFSSRTLTTDNQLQFDVATGPLVHKLLVGIDYSDYRARTRSGYGASIIGTATPIDAYDPQYGNLSPVVLARLPNQTETQRGLYAQDQIKLWDKLMILGGARFDRAINSTEGGERFVDKAWTGRLALSYDLGGIVPYVSWSESFQPLASADITGKPYEPTRGRQYEAGVKWQPDAATFVTVAVYDLKDSGRLIADPTNPFNQIQAGVIRTKGFEIEAQRSIADNLDVIASYAYTRASDGSIDTGGRVFTNQIEAQPRHVASIWGMKRFALSEQLSLRVGAGVRYTSKSYSVSFDDAGNFTLVTPDYVLADTLIGVRRGPWSADVNVTNLFDRKYYASCLGRGDCFPGLRRTASLRVAYRY